MLGPIQSNPAVAGNSEDRDERKLRETCAQFESIFITYLMKSMRKATGVEGFPGSSYESKIVTSMFDENLSISIAKNGGIGLGKILLEQLRTRG